MDATYDIESRVEGEEQPQLEVSPITVYATEYAERCAVVRLLLPTSSSSHTSHVWSRASFVHPSIGFNI